MKHLLLLNRLSQKGAAELLPTLGQKFQIRFCFWLLVGLFLLCPRLIQAQTADLVELTSQEEVNAFDYTEVLGHLFISGPDITDLTPLAKLKKVGDGITMRDNSSLTSLAGLENLTLVAGFFYIYNNRSLTSLAGLENLSSVGDFVIQSNSNLTSLAGLDKLISVGSMGISIKENDNLTSLAGLENLTSVGGNLLIIDNSSLSSLAGLEKLTSVGGDLVIIDNSSLNSLAGLEKLTSLGGALAIYSNAQLSQCCLLLSVIEATQGTINISGNATGCESRAAMEAACALDITAQPESAEVCAGQPVTFSVEATSSGLTYQWQKDGKVIAGATASTYRIAAAQDLDAATYTVIVRNASTFVESQAATLTVNSLPTLAITPIPTSNVYTGGNPQVIYLGYGAQSVQLQASGGIDYSWSPATGLSKSNVAAPVFTPTQAGSYPFNVTATNSSGCQASAVITITVINVRDSSKKGKVLVCHKGGKISIDPVSVPDHLAHGDKLGDCSGAQAGRVASLNVASEPELAAPTTLKGYPNPFSDQTTLEFTFEQDQEYTLAIYDMAGKLVSQLPSGKAKAGERLQVEWQAAPYPKGVYLARLRSSKAIQHLKLVIE